MITVGNRDVAEYYATLLISMLISFNITSINAFIYIFTGHSLNLNNNSKLIIAIEYISISLIIYILFVRNGKHLAIEKLYEDQSRKQKKMGQSVAIGYLTVSIGVAILSLYLMLLKNRQMN